MDNMVKNDKINAGVEEFILCNEDCSVIRKFIIDPDKKMEYGASVVNYVARHGDSSWGILKEFYPSNIEELELVLSRGNDGNVRISMEYPEYESYFKEEYARFIKPYIQLLEIKRQTDTSELLNTFIPYFEIYYSYDRNFKKRDEYGTVYIWMPESKVEPFDKICEYIHKNPYDKPEYNLSLILSSIKNLVQCLTILHMNALVHGDLKPSNFGFLKRECNLLTETVTIFDINTISNIYDVSNVTGTEGFMEVLNDFHKTNDNLSDIYSIGAILFYSLINRTYSDESYDEIDRLVDQSVVLNCSRYNSHPELKKTLKRILKKCLAPRTRNDEFSRYENCEDLERELNQAMFYVLPADIVTRKSNGEKWELKKLESFDSTEDMYKAKLAIKLHLYEHPLYHKAIADKMNIVIAGFENYGQLFLDACLEIMQTMDVKDKNIYVLSDDVKNKKESYLRERPALKEFFLIDGIGEKESYGSIVFRDIKLKSEDAFYDENVWLESIESIDSNDISCLFISLGSDHINQYVAELYDSRLSDCCEKVAFVREKKLVTDNFSRISPVYIYEDKMDLDYYKEIERMAYNTHLVWEKSFNVDMEKVRANFMDPYNYDSSVGFVLAVKYYAHYLKFDGCPDIYSLADSFNNIFKNTKKKSNYTRPLSYMEHKRWVTGMICQGYTSFADSELASCVYNGNKNKKDRQHVCILKSKENNKIRDGFDWDNLKAEDFSKLDQLERMSVKLHQVYCAEAERIKEKGNLILSQFDNLYSAICKNDKAVLAYYEWRACIESIWQKNSMAAKRYKGLMQSFLSCVELADLETVKALVDAFDLAFSPIYKALECENYKYIDLKLINSIPFILTYSTNLHLVIPYINKVDCNIIKNVESVTFFGARYVSYFYDVKNRNDVINFEKTKNYVKNFIVRKKINANIRFYLFIKHDFQAMYYAQDDSVEVIIYRDEEDLNNKIIEIYGKVKEDGDRFAVEKNESEMSKYLEDKALDYEFNLFELENGNVKAEYNNNYILSCNYIDKRTPLTIYDILSLRGITYNAAIKQPDFFSEYKDLWEYYKNNDVTWKNTCSLIKQYFEPKPVLANYLTNGTLSTEIKTYTYLMPVECFVTLGKILAFLSNGGFIDRGSYVKMIKANICKVVIMDRYNNQKSFDLLFKDPSIFILPDNMSMYVQDNAPYIKFNNLVVDNMQLNGPDNLDIADHVIGMLTYMEQRGYIHSLVIDKEKATASMTFGSIEYKDLFSSEGRLLEIYVYHKLKESDQFDDIVCSLEITWDPGTVQGQKKNELDIVVNRGYKVGIIECKAVNNLQEGPFAKLEGICKNFALNPCAIIVNYKSTHISSNGTTDFFDKYSNIFIINDNEQLDKIDAKVLEIMEGSDNICTNQNQ